MPMMEVAQYSELLEPTIRKVSHMALDHLDAHDPLAALVTEGTTEKYTETDMDMGGAPEMPLYTGTIGEEVIAKGHTKQRTVRRIALAYKADWLLLKVDLYGEIKRCSSFLAKSAAIRKRRERRRFFANAFAIVGAESTGGDGQPLISASHTLVTGGGTQSNLITGAITAPNIETGITRMRNFTDNIGNEQDFAPDTLVCDLSQQFTAMKQILSMYDPASANNTVNAVFENYNALTDRNPAALKIKTIKGLTPATAWFLVDSSTAKEVFLIDWLIPVTFFQLNVAMNLHTTYAAYGAFNRGFIGWQAVVGSTGV